MRKHTFSNAIEETPPLSVLRQWHERTVALRIKAVMFEEILSDVHTAKLVKKARILTLIYLN